MRINIFLRQPLCFLFPKPCQRYICFDEKTNYFVRRREGDITMSNMRSSNLDTDWHCRNKNCAFRHCNLNKNFSSSWLIKHCQAKDGWLDEGLSCWPLTFVYDEVTSKVGHDRSIMNHEKTLQITIAWRLISRYQNKHYIKFPYLKHKRLEFFKSEWKNKQNLHILHLSSQWRFTKYISTTSYNEYFILANSVSQIISRCTTIAKRIWLVKDPPPLLPNTSCL